MMLEGSQGGQIVGYIQTEVDLLAEVSEISQEDPVAEKAEGPRGVDPVAWCPLLGLRIRRVFRPIDLHTGVGEGDPKDHHHTLRMEEREDQEARADQAEIIRD